MTPEGKVKKAIRKVLDEQGCYYFMPVQTGFGQKTVDFLVCFQGKFIGIEAKAPGKKPTALQQGYSRSIQKAGGDCLFFDSVEMALSLKDWLEMRVPSLPGKGYK